MKRPAYKRLYRDEQAKSAELDRRVRVLEAWRNELGSAGMAVKRSMRTREPNERGQYWLTRLEWMGLAAAVELLSSSRYAPWGPGGYMADTYSPLQWDGKPVYWKDEEA